MKIVALPIEPINTATGLHSNSATIFGSKFTFAAEPSQPVEGTVRDAKTHEPIAGVHVLDTRFTGKTINDRYVEAISDATGHYRLEGLPKAEGNRVLVMPSDDQPYFMREFELPSGPNFAPVKFDIELHRGVWISGRVSEKATSKGVETWVLYLPFPGNPNIVGLPEFNSGYLTLGFDEGIHTDAEGHYRIVGLPGRGLLGVKCHNVTYKPFLQNQGLNEIADLPSEEEFSRISQLFVPQHGGFVAVKEVRIPDAVAETTADIALDEGRRVPLAAVDPAGRPLSGVTAWGLGPKGRLYEQRDAGASIDVAHFGQMKSGSSCSSKKTRNLAKPYSFLGRMTVPVRCRSN